MSSWAERMHQRAANLGTVVTSCGHSTIPAFRRIEKVKFGAPIGEVCKNDIPGPLLVLILKLNKEGPYKKDVFRAPGHQANMKKLIHFLQTGRLVNIDNFSVYTIASVLKKFFRKLPEGIFGCEGEARLFQIIDLDSIEEQRDQVSWLISSLPLCTQRLIVLLFGTFRVIAQNSEHSQTGMTSEALGVSVAPSFFQSCVSDGKQAKMEDVMKFKVATKIMKFLIDNFGVSNLFGRENYEYYARITGRILKVEEDWIFSFRYPPPPPDHEHPHLKPQISTQPILSSSELEEEMSGGFEEIGCGGVGAEETHCGGDQEGSTMKKRGCLQEEDGNSPLLDSYTRLSISLEDNGIFKESVELSASSTFSLNQLQLTSSPLLPPSSRGGIAPTSSHHHPRSLLLPQVQERQAARMKTRSEWFLSPQPEATSIRRHYFNQPPSREPTPSNHPLPLREGSFKKKNTNTNNNGGGSSKEQRRQLIRRTSSKKKKDKENGHNNNSTNTTPPQNSNSPTASSNSTPQQQQPLPLQPPPPPPPPPNTGEPVEGEEKVKEGVETTLNTQLPSVDGSGGGVGGSYKPRI